MTKPPVPPTWPKEVVDKYEPVRSLGRGAFATVMLAKRKPSEHKNNEKDKENDLVAIKQVRASTNTQIQYCHRELHILQELSHPNIMKVLDSCEPSKGSCLLMLSYARGNTLEYLLKNIGAPSLTFCRVVIAQLVDAVAYLHSHAVIHRDIKPDNLIISNTSLDDKDIVKDSIDSIDISWANQRKKWHLTLIDFGFARALGRKDVQEEEEYKRKVSLHLKETGTQAKGRKKLTSHVSIDDSITSSTAKNRRPLSHADSYASIDELFKQSKDVSKPEDDHTGVSRHLVRGLSALGNRYYAAPEVKNKAREEKLVGESRHRTTTNTLSPFVSDYGMVADAFSVGITARYILTGVPPQDNVEEVIASYNNPAFKALRWLGRKLRKNDKTTRPTKKYRSSDGIPVEAVRLVKDMTMSNAATRISVRDARMNPYVNEVFPESQAFRKDICFLKCAQD